MLRICYNSFKSEPKYDEKHYSYKKTCITVRHNNNFHNEKSQSKRQQKTDESFTLAKYHQFKFLIPKMLAIIFWPFTVFQYRFDLPQVSLVLIFSITNFVYKLPHSLPNNLSGDYILRESQNQVATLPSPQSPIQNSLSITIKIYEDTDIKDFLYCPILLGFLPLTRYFLEASIIGKQL